MIRRRPALLACAAAAAGVLIIAAIDGSGVLRPLPAAAQVVRRMTHAWEELPGYEAEVSAGKWVSMGGGPQACRQWYSRDGAFILAASDQMGFRHVERWEGQTWDYYQPGVDLQVRMTLRNLDRAPYARWLITGFPSLGDLVRTIQDATETRVTGAAMTETGRQWIVDCRPRRLATPAGAGEQDRAFLENAFGRPWRVWLSETTSLPAHVIIGPETEQPFRVGIAAVKSGTPTLPADWRDVLGSGTKVRARLSLQVDVPSAESRAAARAAIQGRVGLWQRSMYARTHPGPTPSRRR